MKNFYKILSVASLAFYTSFNVADSQANVVTLKQALVKGYTTNPQLKAAAANLEASNEDGFIAFSGFLPTVTASGSMGIQKSEVGVNEVEDDTKQYSISVEQPLFRGGATLFAMDRAKNQIEASRQRYKSTEQEIMLNVVRAYMNLVRDRGIYKLSILNERALQQQLNSTKVRFDLGDFTITDVAQAKSRLALATADKISAEGQLVSAESDFQSVIGSKATTLSKPANLPKIPATVRQALDISKQNNPELLASKADYKASDQAVNEAYSSLSPTISAVGSLNHQENNIFGTDIDTQSVTANVNFPLYQAGTRYSNIRRAKRRAENAKQLSINSQRVVDADVISAWKNVETTSSAIEANKTAVNSSKIALDGAKEEMNLGVRSILDVLDTERDYFNSQIRLLRAETDYVVSIYSLLAEMGILNAENLGLGIKPYDIEKNQVKYQLIGW